MSQKLFGFQNKHCIPQHICTKLNPLYNEVTAHTKPKDINNVLVLKWIPRESLVNVTNFFLNTKTYNTRMKTDIAKL